MLSPRRSYLGTEICGLCRLKLPWDDSAGRDPWESTFRAAFCLDSDQDVIKITDPTVFPKGNDSKVEMTLSSSQQTRFITVISWTRRSQRRESQPTAFCFHDFCYLFFKCRVGSCTNSKIYQLARTLSLDSVAWEYADGECRLGSMTKQAFTILANTNRYSQALFPMSRLPIEIRNLIWGYVDLRTAAGAFTIVTGEIFRLAYSLAWPSRRDISMVPGSQISVKTISVFGISYIQVFENKESTITVPDVVKRLSFITVLGGICAIKLFGTNWETDWLGKTPITGPTWYGTMLEIDSSLTCTYNDLYCNRISSQGSSKKSQILWDQPNIPTSLASPKAAFFRDLVQNPEPRFFGYLSLFHGNEYANELTMYLSGNGIVGLEAYFIRTSQLSGSRNGCPKYFPLDPNNPWENLLVWAIYTASTC